MPSIMRDSFKNTFIYCLGVLLVAVIFEIISLSLNDAVIIPSLGVVIKDFFILLGKGETYVFVGYTLLDLVISLVISIILGLALGALVGIKPVLYKIFKPLMSLLRILPVIIFIILIMLFNEIRYVPAIVTTIILIPMIYEGAYQGIIKVDKSLINAYRLDSRFNLRVFNMIYLPLIGSSLKTAIINALGIGIKLVVTTEYICGASHTLGKAIINAVANLEFSYIYAYSIILIILILLIEALPRLIELIANLIKNRRSLVK